MYGGNSKGGVLSGLTKRSGDAGAYGKGKAMAAQAGLGLDQANKDQEFGVQQMQADSQLRQQGNQNMAQRAGNESEARMQKGALDSRRTVFDTSMNFDYAALQKRRQTQLRQSLLNNVARNF